MTENDDPQKTQEADSVPVRVGLGNEVAAASLARLRPRYTAMLKNLAGDFEYETQMRKAETVMDEDTEALEKLSE